jgi:hypothetical protein
VLLRTLQFRSNFGLGARIWNRYFLSSRSGSAQTTDVVVRFCVLWLQQHFELIILVLTVLGVVIAWLQVRKKELPAGNTVTQSPSIAVAPTFNLPQMTIVPGELEKKSAVADPPSAEKAEDGRPELHSLEPRICFVVDEGDGFAEGGNAAKAILATFRMRKIFRRPSGHSRNGAAVVQDDLRNCRADNLERIRSGEPCDVD